MLFLMSEVPLFVLCLMTEVPLYTLLQVLSVSRMSEDDVECKSVCSAKRAYTLRKNANTLRKSANTLRKYVYAAK